MAEVAVAVATACTWQRRARGAGRRLSYLPGVAGLRRAGLVRLPGPAVKKKLRPFTSLVLHAFVAGRAHPDTRRLTLVCDGRALVCIAEVQAGVVAHAQHRRVTPRQTECAQSTYTTSTYGRYLHRDTSSQHILIPEVQTLSFEHLMPTAYEGR